jgi:YggT family protein
MSVLAEALIFLVQSLGSLYVMVVLLRFIMQLVRADFYNPLSQFTVRATQPLLKPLRRVIPGFGGVDLASLLLAVLMQLALYLVIGAIAGTNLLAVLGPLLVWSVIGVTALFLKIFFFAMILSVILSWVAPHSHNPGALLANQICEPLLAPFRKLIPNLGGLDISPVFALLAIHLISGYVLLPLAIETGMPELFIRFL